MSAALVVPQQIVDAMGGRPPTSQQWEAISAPLGPSVLVAGAGSGKTSVMAARVVYLALVALGEIPAEHPGALPGNALCITFTVKATENLRQRVRRALSSVELPAGEEPEILNYHGYAARLIDRYGLRAGAEPGRPVLTTAQQYEIARRVLDRMPFAENSAEWPDTLVSNILNLAGQLSDHLVSPEAVVAYNERMEGAFLKAKAKDVARSSRRRVELAHAVERFSEVKSELGVIDFGDQIRIALDLVREYPDVVAAERERFDVVLLDEYQDTNIAQAALMAELFGDGFPVMAVGDPDQNIYAWRGASLFNLVRFPEQFPADDGTPAVRLPLYANFRSGARILAAADRILEPLPAEQRPDPGKQLEPVPQNGEGHIELARFADEIAEARWIASRIRSLHDAGDVTWGDIAVLCRKSRLFGPLQEAFDEQAIPAEFIGLAGLLKLPVVVEVLAYARAVADPFASTSLARILLGPRYRVGFTDLAVLASWARTRTGRHDDEETMFLLSEALEHLEDPALPPADDGEPMPSMQERLSPEGLSRLRAFRDELAGLRGIAGRPVGEFLAEIVRRTGLAIELDAGADRGPALAARRNLDAFLDTVHAFEPVEGELTLRSFLDHVALVEDSGQEDWAPVQPSDDDAVKVLTIHKAKGLEFDTVFVPGLAGGILPDTTIQQNPAERAYSLDFELRGDRDILPAFDGTVKTFRDDLRAQEEFAERRTLYVALTRAKQRLFVTGSDWYGDGQRPKKRSVFFDELADWATDRDLPVHDVEPPGDEPENPLPAYRAALVRPWPGPATDRSADGPFSAGWRAAALVAAENGGVQSSLLDALPAAERAAFDEAAGRHRTVAAHLRERDEAPTSDRATPTTVSVSGLIEYERCPKRFYWSSVRPLPRFSGPAARIGTEVHRWIELRSQGQATLLEEQTEPDLTDEELAGEPGKVDRLRQAYERSRFAGVAPLYAERAFLLRIGDATVRGRIDAIYGQADGPWEVVDYKTGRKPSEDDPLARLQLDLYALACQEVWHKRPDQINLTYLYLASEDEATYAVDDAERIRERLAVSLEGIAQSRFDPTPGAWCRFCDFRTFCEPGTAWVQAADGPAS